MCGVKTNIITSVNITSKRKADSPQFEALLKKTNENFTIKEVSADKAYSSRKNLELVSEMGGIPYIPFKKDTKGRSKSYPIWKKMFWYFVKHQEEFMQHYHKRSNAESGFFMIKQKILG